MQVAVDFFITGTPVDPNVHGQGTYAQSSGTLIVIFSHSRTGFRKTDTILNRLIRGAIQTGLFAGIFSIGDLITFIAVPSTNLYGMFAIPIGRIYTNVSDLVRMLYFHSSGFVLEDPLGYSPYS